MAISAIAGLASIGSAMIAAGAFSIGWAAAAGAFALGAGLSMVSRALAPKPNIGAQMRGITQTSREPASSRKTIYGRMRVGGQVVFISHSGDDNKFLNMAIVFATHEIQAYDEIWFNDNKVWDTTNGFIDDWGTYVTIDRKFGTSGQAASTQLTGANVLWTANHKLSGIAYIAFKLKWNADKFPQGVPNITAVIRGKKVYDPRDQSIGYSQNPALCLRDYMLDQSYGLGEVAANINNQSVIDAANLCEEQVTLDAGGTQDRYQCNGVIDTANQIKANIEQLLASMGGRLTYSGGEYFVDGAEYKAPTLTFTESDIVSDIQTQTKQSRRGIYNGVKGIFVSEEKNFKVLDYPAQISSTYETEDGDPIYLDMALPCVTNNTQAQRLAKIALLKSRQQVVMTMTTNLKGLRVKVGDTIQVTNDRLNYSSKVFEVIDYSLAITDGALGVNLSCIETASAIYDWTTSDEEDFLSGGELALYDGRTVDNVTSVGHTPIGLKGPDGKLITSVDLAWTAPTDAFIEFYIVTVEKDSDGNVFEYQTREPRLRVPELTIGSAYEFIVKAENLVGVRSTGTTLNVASLAGDTTAPSAPTSTSATGGVRQITAEWTNPTDDDFKHVEVYIADSNSIPGSPHGVVNGEEFVYTLASNETSATTKYFWLKSVDYTGNKSAATASFNATSVVANTTDVTDDITDKVDEIISTLDDDAAGDGTTDDTTALQAAFNSVSTSGRVLDGGNKTYLITTTINVTGAFFRIKNFKFKLGTSYTDQGRINCDAGSGTTKMTIELDNIVIDGGRGDYKVGREPWTVAVSNFFGYNSIQPDLSAIIKVNAFNENTDVRVTNCRFENIHALAAVRVNSYGTTIIQDCVFKNNSFQSFAIFQSADSGTTQGGRTLVSDVYAEDIGLLPDTYDVDGVQKTFSDNSSTQTESPQGSFNYVCSFGEYNITNASVKNYGSCGVTADRNLIFNASNITITNDSTRSFSNNPSGAFWLEDCEIANVTNLHIDVSARAGIDTTALDNSLLQIYLTDNTKCFFNNVFIQTSATTAYFNKLIRGSAKDTTHCNIENFYVSGICRNLDDGVSFLLLPNSAIEHDVRLAHGYIKHGDIKIEVPYNATVQDVYLEGASGNGDVLFPPAGNPGVTGSVGDATVTGCYIDGTVSNTTAFTGSLNIIGNKYIGAVTSSGSGNTGKFVVSDNARIAGGLAVTCSGPTGNSAVEIRGNALIEGVTRVDGANNAIISDNNTERRITIEDVQHFQVVGNTAKTDNAESCIFVNPTTASNILAGIISGNNCLIKTGTSGAGYITLASSVTNVMEGLNNKLIVNWS